MKRNRFVYTVLIIVTIVLGLLSRRYPHFLPAVFGKYPGDALWSLMVFFGLGFLRPRLSTLLICAMAFALSCLVEFSKLYQAAWLESFRDTLIGRLVLGSVFSWSNIAAYAIGILLGGIAEIIFCKFYAGKKSKTN